MLLLVLALDVIEGCAAARPAVVGPSPPLPAVVVGGAEAGPILIGPGVFPKEDIGVFKALEKDLEGASLFGQGLLLAGKSAAVPVGVVEGLGGEPDNFCGRDHVCSELAVEGVCSRLADVGEIGDEAGRRS